MSFIRKRLAGPCLIFFCLLASIACGKKARTIEEPDDTEIEEQDPTEGDLFGGTEGAAGTTTVTTETEEGYEVVVSVGQAVPLSMISSESGVYTIRNTTTF